MAFCLFTMGSSLFVDAQDDVLEWDDREWKSSDEAEYPRGRIVYYSKNIEVCNSWVLVPGTAILPTGLLAIVYASTLIYLFMGIGIVSDVFMNGIERITSEKKTIQIKDENGQVIDTRQVTVWNATIANLSLMALGSSAPEILLSVIETIGQLGKCPGELGASTIVGSAAFNLLVISGVSIYAVSEANDTDEDRDETMPVGVKKINDMGVFSITATSSLFAYIWLFICVSDQEINQAEAWWTFIFFFLLIGLSFAADKYKAMNDEKNALKDGPEGTAGNGQYQALEIYQELMNEKLGKASKAEEAVEKRAEMKKVMRSVQGTDNIEKVNFEEFKKQIEGDTMLGRIKYRKQVGQMMKGKKATVGKGEIMRHEHLHSDKLDDHLKNEHFGFKCLHYSVSEASGTIQIHVINQKGVSGKVRVCTVDQEAKAGKDYEEVKETLQFNDGERTKFITVKIRDDDNWEPDRDFHVQLYDPDTLEVLVGQDCKTRVTIIDDDKPGQIAFEETKAIKAIASDEVGYVVVIRKNGSDGEVKVDYETIQLDDSNHTATAGVDYEYVKDTLVFLHGELTKTIEIKILDNKADVRDESFGVQLSNIRPAGAKLSKRSFQIVNIVTDIESKKKQEALAQLLKKIEDEEETTWYSQFVTACMIHPSKNEDGDIVDIEPFDGFVHFVSIGLKLVFAIIPPPHMLGGWACFFSSLGMIGVVTAVVGEFANLFGCVLGVKPSITAITFVALGTSLPDTFASMAAAQAEKYADSAVGNVTGSNSVNVFLGLGLPWVIAATWSQSFVGDDGVSYPGYYVPAGSLGFSVTVFIIVACVCIFSLLIRRKVVGGELGGSQAGRTASAIFFVSLWFIYIIFSILQAYGLADGLEKALTIGGKKDISDYSESVQYWMKKCVK